jgi:MoaA/NifB/PqqE/SkfB family radical SAM enzyme
LSTVIYPSPIFGPIHSRRLGVSLGINLLPDDGKHCTFDCIYCECGYNKDHHAHHRLPTREEVYAALEARLILMQQNGPHPNVLTFAGNGEPTSHPQFPEIVDDVIALRNKYFPDAKVSVLSNSTFIGRPAVFEALKRLDNNILKLDTRGAEGQQKALEFMGKLLVSLTRDMGFYESFVSHMGGEHFVVSLKLEDHERFTKHLCEAFDKNVLQLYTPEEVQKGYIKAVDRQGNEVRCKLMALSVGVAHTQYRYFKSAKKMFEVLGPGAPDVPPQRG